MKREEMRSIISSELDHIPRDYRGSPQNMFRYSYYHFRRRDLATLQKGKVEVLKSTIEFIEKQYPDFSPKFDDDFFKKK